MRIVCLCALVTLVYVQTVYLPNARALESTRLAQTDPVLVGAGDIAICGSPYPEMTAQLLDGIPGTVYTLGDNAYERGKLTEFQKCYGPTWGRHLARTMPAVGNHEYETEGAGGYYAYFGAAASPLDQPCHHNCKGYYSYNLGAWHIVVLNSEQDVGVTSAQVQWLRADLAANPTSCTLAYWHKPRFSSGVSHGNNPSVQPFWDVLYEHGADVVLGAHDHIYERFAPQSPAGQAAPQNGIRQFVVGTGGKTLHAIGSPRRNSEVRSSHAYGVLKLTLHAESYSWEFMPVEGQGFTDTGSAPCVGILPTSTPTATYTAPPSATPLPTGTAALHPSPTASVAITPPPSPSAAITPPGTSINPTLTPTDGPVPISTEPPTITPTPTDAEQPGGTGGQPGLVLYLPIVNAGQ